MDGFDAVWGRIAALEGQTFHQKTGKPFRYRVVGSSVAPSTTSRQLARSQFARAYERRPLRGPRQLQDLQGPSYLFAILTDSRVAVGEPPTDVVNPAEPAGRRSPLRTTPQASTVPVAGPGPLGEMDPQQAMLIVPCSAAKSRGGQAPSLGGGRDCPESLIEARSRVLATAHADQGRVLPAWQRYQGAFYRQAGSALAEAATAGNVVIISGGYGLVRADEPIGWYDKALRLADWPHGALESALIDLARRAGSRTVFAFAAATTGYAQLVRRTPWRDAGLAAHLVTITGVSAGAMREVPSRLGLAFAAFWHRRGDYPPGLTIERLS